MSDPLLLAFDGSDHAASAVRAAGALLPGREALVLTIWISMRDAGAATRLALPAQVIAEGIAALDEEARGDARHVAEEGVRLAQEAGLRARPIEAARRGTEANTIIDVAHRHDVGVIGVGSRGRSSVKATVLGSTTYRLLHSSRRPVLVARERDPSSSGPIVVCFDGSQPARDAIATAGALLPGARAVIAHIWEPTDERALLRSAAHPLLSPQLRELAEGIDEADQRQAEGIAAEGEQLARAAGLQPTIRTLTLRDGIAETLSHLAEEEAAQVIVAGSRGRSALSSLVLGSVSHGLLHQSSRPLLIVPSP